MIPTLVAIASAMAFAPHPVSAALPQVDFNKMGTVGLAGSFAGLDIFDANTPAIDPSASTLFSHSSANGALSRLAATNSGGSISATCTLGDTVFVAGNFSSLSGVSATNIASYTPSSSSFTALGSNGPNGPISALYCDSKGNKVWAGGKFATPASSIAVWDPKASSWSAPPFGGLAGAEAEVLSISTNSSSSSLFFAGSFTTSFGSNTTTVVNNTNNPNVPFSSGASPFSSSLVPIPLGSAEVDGNPSTSDSQFSNIKNILCPPGDDGPGNTWFAADGNGAQITARAFSFLSASGVRLGNTFLNSRGTTGFRVTTIPDNVVQTLTYFDPAANKNSTCSDNCPLLTDSSVPYQDFLFSQDQNITGVQVTLSTWQGAGPGLHLFQLLSSGAFASALDSDNGKSCFAPQASSSARTGDWSQKTAGTSLPGTVVTTLVSTVKVGTDPSTGPSFTWRPYVSAAGTYDVYMRVPGCTNFQDCALRTSVHVTLFPGPGLNPTVLDVNQQNTNDAVSLLYSGPIVPTTPDFVTTINMVLSSSPAGKGQNGNYELVADRIQLVLRSPNTSGTTQVPGSGSSAQNSTKGFGFFEWPLSNSNGVDATKSLTNASETALDAIALAFSSGLSGAGLTGSSAPVITSVAFHSSGTVFLGGNFSLTSGSGNGATNVVAFKNGGLKALTDNGLNGPVTSLVIDGDNLFVGGAFTGTGSGQTRSQGVIHYDIAQDQWSVLGGGVDGPVNSLSFAGSQLQVAGNFTHLLGSSGSAGGYAVWNTNNNTWSSQSSLLVGVMSFVSNTTSAKGLDTSTLVAGRVSSFSKFGSSGFVTLSNGGSDGVPKISPLGVTLDGASASSNASASRRRRRRATRDVHGFSSWLPKLEFSNIFARAAEARAAPAAQQQLPTPGATSGPAVFAGAFWKNASTEVTIIGGNFSIAGARNVAVYDSSKGTVLALQGAQVDGVVHALLVQGDLLFVGGTFSLDGGANGFAVYDLSKQQWVVGGDALKPSTSEGQVVVRSLTTTQAKNGVVVVAGAFDGAGAFTCNAVCLFDYNAKTWSALGGGITGDVSTVVYAGGDKQDILVAAGALALPDNSQANVVSFSFENSTWSPIGSGLPGPVTALEVNGGNASSIFVAGKSGDNSTFFEMWNGASWTSLGSSLGSISNVTSMTMVPLVDSHSANGIIEQDRMLLVSGALSVGSSNGKRDTPSVASSALFDGQNFIPYLVSQSSGGGAGSVSALIHSFSSFNFSHRHVLATGIVILISIAIAAGIVFLLVLIGIIWALVSRRNDRDVGKYDTDADDDSSHGRPTSLLAHINAATRNTIMGGQSPFGNREKEFAAGAAGAGAGAYATAHSQSEHDHGYGPDADGFERTDTPSEAMGMAMGGDEDGRPARARYSFDGAEDGELPLSAGVEVMILDDRDPAWWYAMDPRTGREGVVPSNYVIAA